jgi:hypothetical protein
MTGDADDVAHIQQLKETKGALSDGIKLHVNLELGAISLNMRETRFAVKAQRENAARSAHIYALAFQCCGIARAMSGNDLRGRRSLIEFTRVGVVAKRFDFGEFFLALEVLVERFERQRGFPFVFLMQYTDAFLGASRKRLL